MNETCKTCKIAFHPWDNVRLMNGFDNRDGYVHYSCTPDYVKYGQILEGNKSSDNWLMKTLRKK
jgi:hypothetical protein